MPKEKLTLSVDKEVVEKAKKLGLNISDLTELALKGATFSAKEADTDTLYKLYEELFAVMKPLLQRYGAFVKIGSEELYDDETGQYIETQNFHLGSDGRFGDDFTDSRFADIRKVPINILDTPSEILSNLLKALADSVPKREAIARDLQVAKRIVEAIATTLESSPRPRAKSRSKRPVSSKSRVT